MSIIDNFPCSILLSLHESKWRECSELKWNQELLASSFTAELFRKLRLHFLNCLFSHSLWLSTTERGRHHLVRVYCKAPWEPTQHCWPTTPQHCWMLHVASVCTPCCVLSGVVVQSLKPVKLLSQQLPTFLLFRDRRSVAQQCWIRLHRSSNIFAAKHAHYTWSLRS